MACIGNSRVARLLAYVLRPGYRRDLRGLPGRCTDASDSAGCRTPDPVADYREVYYRTLDVILDGWPQHRRVPNGLVLAERHAGARIATPASSWLVSSFPVHAGIVPAPRDKGIIVRRMGAAMRVQESESRRRSSAFSSRMRASAASARASATSRAELSLSKAAMCSPVSGSWQASWPSSQRQFTFSAAL